MNWQLKEQQSGLAIFAQGQTKLRLEAYAPNIMRVTQTTQDAFALRNEPMITAPAPTAVMALRADAECAALDCGELTAQLNLVTGALSWLACGQPLMREPDENGRVLREIDIILNRFDPDAPMTEYHSVDGMRARATGTPYVDRRGYQTRLSFAFDDDEAIYGLGQHEQGVLNYRGQHQFLYQHNLKISCPVICSSKGWAVLSNCCGAQIFHDDAYGSYLSADAADELDYFVIFGPEFDRIVAAIRALTGDAPMLPRWALGYVQSKEHYASSAELLDIAREYRKRGVPLDCVVQDWQSWKPGQWGQKTADPERYPDLKAAIDELHALNVKLMWSIWPNMNGDCPNQLEFQQNGQMLGNRRTYNAFDPAARATYWKQCNEQLFSSGLDAWWCDCTEPFEADWYGEVEMLPEDRMYFNVNEFKQYIDPTQILAYSINHSRTLYEGQRATSEAKRVVNLTRSGLTGQQRYATICWNGDTSATWDVLRRTIPDGLNLALCGLPYWTVDAGAFFVKKWKQWFGYGKYEQGCNDQGYRELYVRWLQLSAFLPMMRSHGTDTPREIWRFGAPGEPYYDAIANVIRLRYMLMPYIYSEMAAVHFERSTMLRMLAFDFRTDAVARNVVDQFMFGKSLMICPIVTPMQDGIATRDVYLPEGCDWYDFWSNSRYAGGQWLTVQAPLDSVPIFVRAGAIVPVGPEAQFADEHQGQATALYVFSGADGRFTMYCDAGDGYGYEHGEYLRTTYVWHDAAHELEQTVEGDARFEGVEPEIVII